jgi:hypothetical protein
MAFPVDQSCRTHGSQSIQILQGIMDAFELPPVECIDEA